jgi:RNA polymerase sigma factor (sigma-70 family)
VSDAELIRSSFNDARAFAVIFDRHFRAIFRFLRGRVGRHLAEDLASETFVVSFAHRFSYDLSREDARPWLYGIAVNLLRGHRRAEERRLCAYARVPADQRPASDELGEYLDSSVSAALLELSHEERNLILLLTWADFTYAELAHALDLPVGTIRSRVSRVRSKLRERLTVETSIEARGNGLT